MSSSSSTTPADAAVRRAAPRSGPGRVRTAWTWFLLALWTALMGYTVISIIDPPWLQELAKPGKDSATAIYKNYGDAALRQKRYGLAAAQYERALQIDPTAASVWANLGTTYIQYGLSTESLRTGYTDKGIACLETALKHNPSERLQSVIYHSLGEVYEKRKRPAEAIERYLAAAAHGMRKDAVYHKIGELYLQSNRLDEARLAFEELLAAQLDPLTVYNDMLLRSEDIYANQPEHLDAIRRLKDEPRDLERLSAYDWTLVRNLQRVDRNIANAHDRLAYIYARMNRFDLALAHREKFLAIWPDNQAALREVEMLRQMVQK